MCVTRPALASVIVVALVGSAHASGAHHLRCWRARDPLLVAATVNIDTGRLGTQVGCRLSRSTLFCAPAAKTVVQSNVPLLPIDGPGLTDGRICYKVKCPERAGTQVVSDQFGTHQLLQPTPTLLCTPA